MLLAAVVNDDAPVVIVDVERNETVVVPLVLVDEDYDAGCSVAPCSGDSSGGACSVYLSARDDFSVPGREDDSSTTWLCRTTRIGIGLLMVIGRRRLPPTHSASMVLLA